MCLSSSIFNCFRRKGKSKKHNRRISSPILNYNAAHTERLSLRSLGNENDPQSPDDIPLRRLSLPPELQAAIAELNLHGHSATSSSFPQGDNTAMANGLNEPAPIDTAVNDERSCNGDLEVGVDAGSVAAFGGQRKMSLEGREDRG
ncbi:hypothetical protein PRK78_007324 [Emydomyces testavorans]|uniref:Uncharacterized protein n=1 Tax=Emydomyces testavorans TaxID=2070801 RepID=A0AAF0ILK7_9EURO|nr:hypothetical protein PRK78_007324 [Emydomyces testavorans]